MDMWKDHYANAEITVFWDPSKCVHSGVCYSRLRSVFDPLQRPWIRMNGARNEQIIETVRQCPSGALSFVRNAELEEQTIAGLVFRPGK